ncbi:MAG: lysophospholipase [Desulfobacterales bacterium]|nr:lysophospholipase [Desulfobacterales bacterium]
MVKFRIGRKESRDGTDSHRKSSPWMWRITGLILAVVVFFMVGPEVKIDTTIHPMNLPENLDDYLKTSENRFSDIIPGTEKTILWAGEQGAQTELGIVYVHGFSATRQETAPLCDVVARTLRANLFYTRLNGHGRTGEALAEANVNAWLNDAVEAFEIGRRIGRRVILVGTSTGGTALTWLVDWAAENGRADTIAALILISPNYGVADPTAVVLTLPWGGQIAELFVGKERHWEAENELQEKFWTNRYPTRGLLPMMGLVNLVNGIDLSGITSPVQVFYSPEDQVVSVAKIEQAFAAFGSSRKQLVPVTDTTSESRHVLAGDILSPGTTIPIAEKILRFISLQ